MTDDVEFLANYKSDTLYVHPDSKGTGAYTSLLAEGEELLFELEITSRFRLALSMFYVNQREDFNRFKLTKLKFHKTHGWQPDGEVIINGFGILKLKEFIELLAGLNFKDASKSKISLPNLNFQNLNAIFKTDKGAELLKQISETPELSEDIFALAHKKKELETFRKLLEEFTSYKDEYISKHALKKTGEEDIWQHFFENNPWIFGHGLNYIFLDKDGKKLEAMTTGYNHNQAGNRVDALMRTKAVISQYVLIEIKTPSAQLLQSKPYRSGCWATSTDLTDAVSQIQKTVFDFTSNQIPKVQVKAEDGHITGDEIFRVQPKSYLVIGNLSQLKNHDEKFTCFQLFRSSLTSPEILTYDELYERAKCIVETVSSKRSLQTQENENDDDIIPF
jgi:hypothetical protein